MGKRSSSCGRKEDIILVVPHRTRLQWYCKVLCGKHFPNMDEFEWLTSCDLEDKL